MHRSAGILLLLAGLAASCAPTPSSSPGLAAPLPSTTHPVTAAPNPASNAPTPAASSTPFTGGAGWPLTVSSDRTGEPVFGPDGTVYLLSGTPGAEGQLQLSLVALDAAGRVKPGWPIEGPRATDVGSPAVDRDGSVYFEECGGPAGGCRVHRLDATGRELPGWPFEEPADFGCPGDNICGSIVGFGTNGTTYLSHWREVGGLQVIAINASGGLVAGWPVVPPAEGMWWSNAQVGSDGTLFIIGLPDGSDRPAELSAFAPDGGSRPGWPVEVPDRSDFILGPEGTVVVWSLIDLQGELCAEPRRTLFTVLGADGGTLRGWPRGSKGYASSPVVGADGTVYYISALGNVYAHDRGGDVKAGWPVAVPGAQAVCGPATPYLAPDGTIYILVDDSPRASEVTALLPDGHSRAGWPYHPDGQLVWLPGTDTDGFTRPGAPAFRPDGTVYLVVFHTEATGVTTEVVAVDREGQLKHGWPYRLTIDLARGEDASLSVSPDGRLFVRTGSSQEYGLVALDPDGSVSD